MKHTARTLKKVLNALEYEQGRLASATIWIPQIGGLVEQLGELGCDAAFYQNSLDVSLSGGPAKLLQVLAAIKAAGYRPDSGNKAPDAPQEVWNGRFLKAGLEDGDENLWPMIEVRFCSEVCRRVQIGTKMVETPVYEIRCGEADEPPPDVPAPCEDAFQQPSEKAADPF